MKHHRYHSKQSALLLGLGAFLVKLMLTKEPTNRHPLSQYRVDADMLLFADRINESEGREQMLATTRKQRNSSDERGPLNLQLAFIGDSLTRHQHLSLVLYLHAGRWPQDGRYIEGGFPTKLAHRTFISDTLNHTEACDCWRPEGHYMTVKRLHVIYENKYYRDSQRNNHVTMITKCGHFDAHGHWDPKTVYRPEKHAGYAAQNGVPVKTVPPYLWRGNWTHVIRHHLAQLQPKPTYVVINAGMWPHDLDDNVTLPAIRQALDDTGMIGIYRTTTKQLKDTSTHLVPHDVQGCHWLHYCMDVSWTGNITDKSLYMDPKHFRSKVYEKMNVQLLKLLQEIQSGVYVKNYRQWNE